MLLTSHTRAWLTSPAAILALLLLSPVIPAQARPSSQPAATAASDLSPAQQARIQAIQVQLRKDVTALGADTKLTNAQKQTKYTALLQAADNSVLTVLTPAQRAGELRRRQISTQFRKDATALRDDPKLTDAQKKSRLTALAEKADADTMTTLSPAQKALVLKQRHTQEEAIQLAQELQKSQSPAQAKQIRDLSLSLRTQMQAVVADKRLSNPAKAAKIKELTVQQQAKLSALLTPAQRIKFQQWQRLVSASQAR